jgi:hypothetical protein
MRGGAYISHRTIGMKNEDAITSAIEIVKARVE